MLVEKINKLNYWPLYQIATTPSLKLAKKNVYLSFPYKENLNKRQCSVLILRLWKSN
jgi:hypothetical protein